MLLEAAINKIDELFNSEGPSQGRKTHITRNLMKLPRALKKQDLIMPVD